MGCVTEILKSTNLTSAGDHQAGPRVWRSHANLVVCQLSETLLAQDRHDHGPD